MRLVRQAKLRVAPALALSARNPPPTRQEKPDIADYRRATRIGRSSAARLRLRQWSVPAQIASHRGRVRPPPRSGPTVPGSLGLAARPRTGDLRRNPYFPGL